MIHEYAGFQYEMVLDETGKAIRALPYPHQHSAASKEKHRRAAIDTYNEERRK